MLHFSEDASITLFEPHVAASAKLPEALVWAVDAARSPDYWFPRQCPRAMAWALPETTPLDRAEVLGPAAERVHVIEYDWLAGMLAVELFVYRLPAATFRPFGDPVRHAHVSRVAVRPLGEPEPVGDLIQLHAAAGIELRLVNDIWTFVDRAFPSTVGYSGIRLSNARPRAHAHSPSLSADRGAVSP